MHAHLHREAWGGSALQLTHDVPVTTSAARDTGSHLSARALPLRKLLMGRVLYRRCSKQAQPMSSAARVHMPSPLLLECRRLRTPLDSLAAFIRRQCDPQLHLWLYGSLKPPCPKPMLHEKFTVEIKGSGVPQLRWSGAKRPVSCAGAPQPSQREKRGPFKGVSNPSAGAHA